MTSSALSPSAVARLIGGEPLAQIQIGGGRNSRVFRVKAPDGQSYALKAYFRHPGDPRDRLATEFGALSFLWQQGLRTIPRPVAFDSEHALGLYEFIQGTRPDPPSPEDIDAAIDFLVGLSPLRGASEARSFPPASEATFSLEALIGSIQARVDRLDAIDPALARESGLTVFLAEELIPAWRSLSAECRSEYHRHGLSPDQELPVAGRVLSPSDFGFHNALRRKDALVFLDFEYFGWDDPAKMIADFLLHPGMDLSLDLRACFAEGLLERLPLEGLRRRTRLTFPLFGIKWCLILLNEFLPGPLDRRAFADPDACPTRERQIVQLAKTRLKLQQLLDDHAHFPYFHE